MNDSYAVYLNTHCNMNGGRDQEHWYILNIIAFEYMMFFSVYLQVFFSLFPRVDSIMLVEEGFNMVSVDASDKMLKYALKSRWERRKEPAFDKWGKAFLIFAIFSL